MKKYKCIFNQFKEKLRCVLIPCPGPTKGKNQVILEHPIIHFATSEEVSEVSEQASA